MSTENEELYERLRAGDKSALGDLRAKYDGIIVAHAKKKLGTKDEDIRHDIAQRVWIKILLKQAVWDGRCRFKTWLLTVTTNTCIDEIRDRQMRRADSTEDLGVGSADDGRADLEHDVTNAVGTLSAVERELIRLRINEGLTVKEIVEKTGMSEGTVNRRIAEAFAKLKKQLPGYGPRE